jgi:lysyl-tRNA synthetase class 2
LKKRKAAREREEKKKAAIAGTPAKAQKAANDDDLPPHVRFYFRFTEPEPWGTYSPGQLYYANRSKQILDLRKSRNPDPYPHKFHVSISMTDYIEKYGPEGVIAPGQKIESDIVSVAGRVHDVRKAGKHLIFYDLRGEGAKIQVMAAAQ